MWGGGIYMYACVYMCTHMYYIHIYMHTHTNTYISWSCDQLSVLKFAYPYWICRFKSLRAKLCLSTDLCLKNLNTRSQGGPNLWVTVQIFLSHGLHPQFFSFGRHIRAAGDSCTGSSRCQHSLWLGPRSVVGWQIPNGTNPSGEPEAADTSDNISS